MVIVAKIWSYELKLITFELVSFNLPSVARLTKTGEVKQCKTFNHLFQLFIGSVNSTTGIVRVRKKYIGN